jgi:cytochrome oxidase assembly protein ShyY1
VPRLDVSAIEARLDEPVEPVWLQLADDGSGGLATFPDPVALPPIDAGPHLGYAGQWFIFAVLGTGFYLALLWRNARGAASVRPAKLRGSTDV